MVDDGSIVGPKSIRAVFLEREWFLYILSVLRNLSYEREKISDIFFISFLPKKTQV